jgi:hypothetical protein
MKTIIFLIAVLLITGFLVGCSSNSISNAGLSTPEGAAAALWSCIGAQTEGCYYELSSKEIQQQCDMEDSQCKQTQSNLYGATVLTRGKEVFNSNNFRIEVEMISDTEATAKVFAPIDTTWPNEISLIKEGNEWKNKKIMLS